MFSTDYGLGLVNGATNGPDNHAADADDAYAVTLALAAHDYPSSNVFLGNIPDIHIHGTKVQVLSYPSAIGKVLSHLINDSIEHGFKDTGPAVIDIEIKALEQAVEIKYQDNGKGIDKDKLGKIFDPFYTDRLGSARPETHVSICQLADRALCSEVVRLMIQ